MKELNLYGQIASSLEYNIRKYLKRFTEIYSIEEEEFIPEGPHTEK